jgi:hypothetical protein
MKNVGRDQASEGGGGKAFFIARADQDVKTFLGESLDVLVQLGR